MRSPEVGLEDHAIQVRVESDSGANVGGLEGKAHDDTEHGAVKEEVFVDGVIGWCAGRNVLESTVELPVVAFCLSEARVFTSYIGPSASCF